MTQETRRRMVRICDKCGAGFTAQSLHLGVHVDPVWMIAYDIAGDMRVGPRTGVCGGQIVAMEWVDVSVP